MTEENALGHLEAAQKWILGIVGIFLTAVYTTALAMTVLNLVQVRERKILALLRT